MLGYMTDNLMAWLGPAADELTAAQIERLREASADIDTRYPEPDQEGERQVALATSVQYLLGETTAGDAARLLVEARRVEREAYVSAVQLAVMMARAGTAKAVAARECGIARMSLLQALGER